MAGILEVLRAAAAPAAEARTGFLRGKEYRRKEDLAEGERQRQVQRQERLDKEERERYDASQARQRELDQRQSVLDQHRAALEDAQAAEARDRGVYYRGGGAAGARFRGSGAKGEITPKDRAAYIRMKSMPHYNPDTGDFEPGMTAEEAAREFDSVVVGKPEAAPKVRGDGTGVAVEGDGKTKYLSPFSLRHGQVRVGGDSTPPAQRPDTATKTSGPISQMRGAVNAEMTKETKRVPKPAVDSATLAKKYPFLFQ